MEPEAKEMIVVCLEQSEFFEGGSGVQVAEMRKLVSGAIAVLHLF